MVIMGAQKTHLFYNTGYTFFDSSGSLFNSKLGGGAITEISLHPPISISVKSLSLFLSLQSDFEE